jgi:hypothetical protein
MKKRHFIQKIDALAFVKNLGLPPEKLKIYHGGTVWVVLFKH